MEIKLGIGIHWLEDMSYQDMVAHIQEIEQLGYDQIWVSNEKFFKDMYVVAAVAAEHTNHPLIGTFIADPYSHHPALTASAVGTLDIISSGRAVLGIGAGGTGFPVMGITRIKPAAAIKDSIHIIRGLWSGNLVDYKGEVVDCHNGRLNFKTRSDIPIVVATRGDLVLQTAGEAADAVMVATYAEPVGIRHALEMIDKGANRRGRNLGDLTIISRVDACISEDRRAAYDAVKPMVGVFLWTSYPDRKFVHQVGLQVPDELEAVIARRDYNLIAPNAHLIPDEFVDKFCWAGTAQEVAQKVAQVVKMGIHNITFLPHPPSGGGTHETMREFARTVKPLVEDMVNEGFYG